MNCVLSERLRSACAISLFRVFAVRRKKPCVFINPLSPKWRPLSDWVECVCVCVCVCACACACVCVCVDFDMVRLFACMPKELRARWNTGFINNVLLTRNTVWSPDFLKYACWMVSIWAGEQRQITFSPTGEGTRSAGREVLHSTASL